MITNAEKDLRREIILVANENSFNPQPLLRLVVKMRSAVREETKAETGVGVPIYKGMFPRVANPHLQVLGTDSTLPSPERLDTEEGEG